MPHPNPLIEGFTRGLQIPYEGTVQEWISEYVVMPHSARSKKHDKTVMPQWTDIFNAVNNPQYRCVSVLAPPGGGKTGGIECITSWIIKESPGPTGIYSQTDETTEFWAKTRLQPVCKATPPVAALLPTNPFDIKKDEMHFPHMYIVLGGANVTNTQEKSLQYAIGDEVWKWKHGLIKELEARLHDRWNGKLMLFSQGGWTDSELESRHLQGTQHYWGFTCPCCKQWNRFTWSLFHYTKIFQSDGNLDWQKTEKSVTLQCSCGKFSLEDNTQNRRMVCNLGSYKQTNFNNVQEWASFQFSAFGVWQIPWGRLVREWIIANKAKEEHDMDLLQKFIQKRCVEFADASVIESLESEPLYSRRENYDADHIPSNVIALSAGVDTQDDRLEVTVWGYGNMFESWAICHRIFLGDPTSPEVWTDLEDFRLANFERMDGTMLNINIMGIDTGRHPNDVYAYVRPRQGQKVYAFKGSSEANMPIVSRPKKSGVEKARLFMVGTDTAKTRIYSRLQIEKPKDWKDGETCPGYIHFPSTDDFDETWFKQLVSEKVITKITKGERVKAYEKHGRNEALDCRVYADAAIQILNPNFAKLALRLGSAKSGSDAKPIIRNSEGDGPSPVPVGNSSEGTPNEAENQETGDEPQRQNRSRRRRRVRGTWMGGVMGNKTHGYLR